MFGIPVFYYRGYFAERPVVLLKCRRQVRECFGQQPKHENDYRCVENKLQDRIACQVAGFDSGKTKQRQHSERVDEIRQRLGGIVYLHDPGKVHFELIGCFHDIRSFNDPFAAP